MARPRVGSENRATSHRAPGRGPADQFTTSDRRRSWSSSSATAAGVRAPRSVSSMLTCIRVGACESMHVQCMHGCAGHRRGEPAAAVSNRGAAARRSCRCRALQVRSLSAPPPHAAAVPRRAVRQTRRASSLAPGRRRLPRHHDGCMPAHPMGAGPSPPRCSPRAHPRRRLRISYRPSGSGSAAPRPAEACDARAPHKRR